MSNDPLDRARQQFSRPQAPQSDDVVVPYRDGRRKRPAEARDAAEPSKPNEPPTPDKTR